MMTNLCEKRTPVLIVRGIDCSDRYMQYIESAIKDSGVRHVSYASFTPRFGGASLDKIAAQIEEAATQLQTQTGSDKIDVVAYSMGALASRYYIQRLKGHEDVRKFVSISGPHNGTFMAYFRYFQEGVRDMVPGSALLNDLNSDVDPFPNTEVYSFYTPYDFIVPPASSILKGSEVKSFQVALHQQMVRDPEVIKAVVSVLQKTLVEASL